jgi:LEA14-like dessication related protein
MKKGIGFLIFGVLFGGVAYGAWWYYRQRGLLTGTKVSFSSIEFVNLSFPNIELNVYLSVLNRSDIPFTVRSYALDVALNDKPITKLSWDGDIRVDAGKSNKFPLNVKLNLKDFAQGGLKNLVGFLGDMGKPLTMKITGGLSAKTSFATVNNMPVEQTFDLGALLRKKMTGA